MTNVWGKLVIQFFKYAPSYVGESWGLEVGYLQ